MLFAILLAFVLSAFGYITLLAGCYEGVSLLPSSCLPRRYMGGQVGVLYLPLAFHICMWKGGEDPEKSHSTIIATKYRCSGSVVIQ